MSSRQLVTHQCLSLLSAYCGANAELRAWHESPVTQQLRHRGVPEDHTHSKALGAGVNVSLPSSDADQCIIHMSFTVKFDD